MTMKFTVTCTACSHQLTHRTSEEEYRELIRTLTLNLECPQALCGSMIRIRMLEDSSIVSDSRREELLSRPPGGSESELAAAAPALPGNLPVSSTQPAGSLRPGIKETVFLPKSEPAMETPRGVGDRNLTPRQTERHVPQPASEIDHRDRISNSQEVAAEPVNSNGMRFRPTKVTVDDAEVVITPAPVLRKKVSRQSGQSLLLEFSRLPAFVQYILPGLMFAATLMLIIFPGLRQNRKDASSGGGNAVQSQPAAPLDSSAANGDELSRKVPSATGDASEFQTVPDLNANRIEEPTPHVSPATQQPQAVKQTFPERPAEDSSSIKSGE
jgi:hypothetical protein